MMKTIWWMLAGVLLLGRAASQAEVNVENMTAAQTPGTKLVSIGYDVSSDVTNSVSITLRAYDGETEVLLSSLTGDAGTGVATGSGKSIVWDAGADWPGLYSGGLKFYVQADDGSGTSSLPDGAVMVLAGSHSGDDPDFGSFSLELTDNLYADELEVTLEVWSNVYRWAVAHDYDFDNEGMACTNGHPITAVNWFDCIKWCNARSEMEGLTPCYTVAGMTYRSGNEIPVWDVNAEGYRLPSSEEWEYAARAGMETRFPFGDTITHEQANYFSSSSPVYDESATGGFHPSSGEEWPLTLPGGSFAPNSFSLYDTSGNVWEWCWDADASGTNRIFRGGSWLHGADSARCGSSFSDLPANSALYVGFRTVRKAEASDLGFAVAMVDTRDYILAVISKGAETTPAEGFYAYAWGTEVECSSVSTFTESNTIYVLKGWTGSGSVPANGSSGSTGIIPLTDPESTIVWQWIADNDYDDLPNDWELVYSGSVTGMVASADSDLDGYSNQQEFWLGTDPTNALSSINLRISTTNGAVLLSCQTVADCTYTIEYSESLISAEWSELTSFSGTGGIYTVEDIRTESTGMYRLKVVFNFGTTYVWQPSADSDGDELPNDWERAYFGSEEGAVASMDSDFDGYTNIEELWLGTDPTDPDSQLDFSVAFSSGTTLISCWTAADRFYVIEYSDSLYPAQWKLLTGFLGVGGPSQYADPAATAAFRYYRMRVILPRGIEL